MSSAITVACIQLTSSNDITQNIEVANARISKVAAAGAKLIALPENAFFMDGNSKKLFEKTYSTECHPAICAMQSLAERLKVYILIGSVAVQDSANVERDTGEEAIKKLLNRSVLIDPTGNITATYDKIHLFDVELPTGEKHRESDRFKAGSKYVVTEVADGESVIAKLGLTICYDVRFPNQYRQMAHDGAEIFAVPAAFTVPTGKAHWHTLLRARAIENGAFVIAPAQVGEHSGGRKTYGHSLIINPWGEIIAEAGDWDEFIIASLNLSEVATARRSIPVLDHAL